MATKKTTTTTTGKITKSAILSIVSAVLLVASNYIDLSEYVPFINQIVEGICGVLVLIGVIVDGKGKTNTVEEVIDETEKGQEEATEAVTEEAKIISTHTFNLPGGSDNE